MSTLAVHLPGHSYQITVEPGALDRLGSIVRGTAPHGRCAVLADEAVYGLYGRRAVGSLEAAGYEVAAAVQPSGERHKTLDTVREFYDKLSAAGMERRSPVVTLGGGVNGDCAGFAAATYLRGVPLVQCPTSLLAMVDASVGGKVGVNIPQGKNLVGSFYQPCAVVVDPSVLSTLPERELRCGLAECVKHAMLADPVLLDWIERSTGAILGCEPEAAAELVRRNIAVKAAVVAADEKEQGVRAHLNLGHTFAHAIEKTSGYGVIHHGEAVSLGLCAASRLAARLGHCSEELPRRIAALLDKLGLPLRAELASAETLIEAMKLDKKVRDGRIRLVLPCGPGTVRLFDDVSHADTVWAWEQIRA